MTPHQLDYMIQIALLNLNRDETIMTFNTALLFPVMVSSNFWPNMTSELPEDSGARFWVHIEAEPFEKRCLTSGVTGLMS